MEENDAQRFTLVLRPLGHIGLQRPKALLPNELAQKVFPIWFVRAVLG